MATLLEKFDEFMVKYNDDRVRNAQFRGEVRQHLKQLNGTVRQNCDDIQELQEQTALARLVQKYPKTSIFLLGALISAMLGVPIVLST